MRAILLWHRHQFFIIQYLDHPSFSPQIKSPVVGNKVAFLHLLHRVIISEFLNKVLRLTLFSHLKPCSDLHLFNNLHPLRNKTCLVNQFLEMQLPINSRAYLQLVQPINNRAYLQALIIQFFLYPNLVCLGNQKWFHKLKGSQHHSHFLKPKFLNPHNYLRLQLM